MLNADVTSFWQLFEVWTPFTTIQSQFFNFVMVCFWEERKPVGCNNTVPFPRSLMHSLPGRGRQFAICCKTPPKCLFVGYFALLCSETGSYG